MVESQINWGHLIDYILNYVLKMKKLLLIEKRKKAKQLHKEKSINKNLQDGKSNKEYTEPSKESLLY